MEQSALLALKRDNLLQRILLFAAANEVSITSETASLTIVLREGDSKLGLQIVQQLENIGFQIHGTLKTPIMTEVPLRVYWGFSNPCKLFEAVILAFENTAWLTVKPFISGIINASSLKLSAKPSDDEVSKLLLDRRILRVKGMLMSSFMAGAAVLFLPHKTE